MLVKTLHEEKNQILFSNYAKRKMSWQTNDSNGYPD